MSSSNLHSNSTLFTSISKPKATALFVFIVLFAMISFFINLKFESLKQRQELEMSIILNAAHKNLEQTLKAAYNSNLAIATTINDKSFADNFEKVAADVIELNPIIDVVELAPNGVIKYVYPLKSNESALDYNILTSAEVSEEAKIAIQKKSVYFAGPLELKQGGIAVIGRYPIFTKDKFWGFSAIIVRFDELMDATGIYSNTNPNYFFQFSKVNSKTDKEVFFLSQPTDFKNSVYQKVFIPDGDWNLYLVSKDTNLYFQSDLIPYLLFCLFALLFIPYFVYIILKKPKELALINNEQAKKIMQVDAKYQVIFDKTSIAIVQIRSENQEIIEVNPRFCQLVESDDYELKGKSFLEFIHPEDLENFNQFIQFTRVIVKDNKAITLRLKNKTNTYIWTHIVPSLLIDESHANKTVILAIEDISERKSAEEKLIQSELQFKSLFNESPIALWEEDGSAVINYFNKLDLFNKDRQFVKDFLENNKPILFEIISQIKVLKINQECLNLYGAKDQHELIEVFKATMQLSPTNAIIEILVDISQGLLKGRTQGKVIFPSGRVAIHALTWNVVAGYEDNLSRFVLSTEDITPQIQAQQLIVESEKKLQTLINSIDGIVWECDISTFKFNYISAKAKSILGYESHEWIEDVTFWPSKIHPEDLQRVIQTFKENIATEKNFSCEYRMISKSDSVLWFRDVVNVYQDAQGNKKLRGIMIDITLIKDNAAELSQSLEMVTEQNKRLLNFSYIVSHNLRSHTSNIQSLAMLIKESDNIAEQKKLIELVGTVSNDLDETIFNLNEVVNIRKNVNLNVQSLKLVEYILKTLDVIHEDIRKKKIKIIGVIPPHVHVNYNKAYLQSVLINIVSNAVRYCSKTSEERFIEFKFTEGAPFSVLEIQDNGIGINMQRNKDKIFGLYKTFSNNKDAKGIGLFITKNQVEAMGGKIEIESELHKGTAVKIYFKN